MTVTEVSKDPENLSMVITTELEAPASRAWKLWEDPRQLERWWGPPGYPATFVDHQFEPGGAVRYYMTDPEGQRYHGWWRIISLDPPGKLELEDGFADDTGESNPHMPTSVMTVTIDDIGDGRARMSIKTTFPTQEAMEKVLEMGMEEGMKEALGQIEAILAEHSA